MKNYSFALAKDPRKDLVEEEVPDCFVRHIGPWCTCYLLTGGANHEIRKLGKTQNVILGIFCTSKVRCSVFINPAVKPVVVFDWSFERRQDSESPVQLLRIRGDLLQFR